MYSQPMILCPECDSKEIFYREDVTNFHRAEWGEYGIQLYELVDSVENGGEPDFLCETCGTSFTWTEIEDYNAEFYGDENENE
jgi:hypothetical protein